MKRGLLPLMLCALSAWPAWADGDQASITSVPSPIVSTKPFEVTIRTTDFGSDVYCYTWAILPSDVRQASDWAGSIAPKFKMSGSNGSYSLKVDDIKSFYNLSDNDLSQLTKIEFIARTSSGSQTADCFVEVTQGSTSYSGGSGTSADPYILKTAKDLTDFASTPADWAAGVCARLDADITLVSFSGIGSKENPYKGTFDGNNHLVKGLTLSNTSFGSPTGFFNAIDGADVSRLGIVDASVSGTTFTGILIGYAASGKVSRCFTTGSVTASSICAGGLVGDNSAEITDCYSVATVTVADDFAAGGLAGKNRGKITNCYASGAVKAHNYAGGLVGANYGTVTASTSFNPSVAAEGNYAGRSGGNANSENNCVNTLAWTGMAMAADATHGYHASDHSYSLLEKETYSNTLGWDFNSVWEWKTEGTHRYPVLAGIAGQPDPGHEAFYANSAVERIDQDQTRVSVFPNPVEEMLNVTAGKSMTRIALYSLNGMEAASAAPGATGTRIDSSQLTGGLYLLCVEFADGSRSVNKIIKK